VKGEHSSKAVTVVAGAETWLARAGTGPVQSSGAKKHCELCVRYGRWPLRIDICLTWDFATRGLGEVMRNNLNTW